MAKKKKPAPISMKLARKPVVPEVVDPVEPFNAVSPITAEQMARAEGDIKSLRKDVKDLAKRPPPNVEVEVPTPQVVIPARARIGKITIKYDQLGFPTELIPQYVEVEV